MATACTKTTTTTNPSQNPLLEFRGGAPNANNKKKKKKGHHDDDDKNLAHNPRAAAAGIIASRYKCKPCQNFEAKGSCPYEVRCMFAHGPGDLRTKELNLAEGITSEEAIKERRCQQQVVAATDSILARINHHAGRGLHSDGASRKQQQQQQGEDKGEEEQETKTAETGSAGVTVVAKTKTPPIAPASAGSASLSQQHIITIPLHLNILGPTLPKKVVAPAAADDATGLCAFDPVHGHNASTPRIRGFGGGGSTTTESNTTSMNGSVTTLGHQVCGMTPDHLGGSYQEDTTPTTYKGMSSRSNTTTPIKWQDPSTPHQQEAFHLPSWPSLEDASTLGGMETQTHTGSGSGSNNNDEDNNPPTLAQSAVGATSTASNSSRSLEALSPPGPTARCVAPKQQQQQQVDESVNQVLKRVSEYTAGNRAAEGQDAMMLELVHQVKFWQHMVRTYHDHEVKLVDAIRILDHHLDSVPHIRRLTAHELAQGFYTHSPYAIWSFNVDCGCQKCLATNSV